MTIGNDTLPGIVTDVESIPTVRLGGISNANVAIVGSGDIAGGEATANQAYTITRPTTVGDLFGKDTPLANQVSDAFTEGAMPVYAVMTDEVTSTDDLSGVTQTSGTLVDAPMVEDVGSITFTVDTTDLTVILSYGDPVDETPEVGEVAVNPVTGDYELGEVPSTSGSAEYESLDYAGALAELQTEEADEIDAIGVIAENGDVANELEATINQMESFHQFAVGVVGAGTTVVTADYSSQFDNSRMAVPYPTRNVDWEPIVGSIMGLIGNLGLNGSIMNKRLSGHSRLSHRIDRGEQADLVGANVIPVASETQGALIVDDITSVADNNAEESKMDTVFNRLVIDNITTIVNEEEQQFIGKLNKPSVRGALRALLNAQLSFLTEQDAILDYEVRVEKRDADSAFVDLSIETVEPLRNVYNKIAVGRID